MYIDDILAKYPVLINPQMGFAGEQLRKALEDAYLEGKKDQLKALDKMPVEVSRFKEKGKLQEYYLKSSFTQRLLNEIK